MSRIRVGVIGVGTAAWRAHLPALSELAEFELVALCDRSQEQLTRAASRWPVRHACTDANAFLQMPEIDAVIVSTPPDSHGAIACQAISAHKHVLVEKPLARSLSECNSMVELGRRNGVILLVGHEKRFPSLEIVHSILDSGDIGRPFYCGIHWASNAKMDPEHLIPKGYRPGYEWRWRDTSVGGGILQDHLPHYGDLIRHWLKVDPEAVYALNINIARDWLGWPEKQSVWEDMALVVVRFSGGFILRFETGTVGRSLSPLFSQGSGIGEWTEYGYIFGTGGQMVFDLLPWDSSENGRIAVWRLKSATNEGRGWCFVEQPEPSRAVGSPAGASHTMFSGQLRNFAKAIRGQPHRAATGEDGAICVALVEGAYQSVRTHQEYRLLQASE